MGAIVTFIIPVRHPANSADWGRQQANLAQTIRSIAAQTVAGWRAVIVANHGAALPEIPAGVEVARVDFPPNPHHEQGNLDRETFYQAVRLDKGRRILAGMLSRRDTDYFMVVDDDDFISRHLVEHVARDPTRPGWAIKRGYLWSDGSGLLLQHNDFYNFCGSSLIIRSDLYGLPERFAAASDDYVRTMLGSHVKIAPILAGRGTPLAPLPFRGAVYRVGHAGSHSRSRKALDMLQLSRRHPAEWWPALKTLAKIRGLTAARRAEFFGE